MPRRIRKNWHPPKCLILQSLSRPRISTPWLKTDFKVSIQLLLTQFYCNNTLRKQSSTFQAPRSTRLCKKEKLKCTLTGDYERYHKMWRRSSRNIYLPSFPTPSLKWFGKGSVYLNAFVNVSTFLRLAPCIAGSRSIQAKYINMHAAPERNIVLFHLDVCKLFTPGLSMCLIRKQYLIRILAQ